MAKHNDMPELNSAKVFLTNLFTKPRRRLPRQLNQQAGKYTYSLIYPLQQGLPPTRHSKHSSTSYGVINYHNCKAQEANNNAVMAKAHP